MTLVRPHTQFGVAMLDEHGNGERIERFVEKPRMEQWVNGGFMFCEPRTLAYMSPDSVLEHEPFERLAADGELQRLEAHWILGLHGHLQGRRGPERSLGHRFSSMARLGGGRLGDATADLDRDQGQTVQALRMGSGFLQGSGVVEHGCLLQDPSKRQFGARRKLNRPARHRISRPSNTRRMR